MHDNKPLLIFFYEQGWVYKQPLQACHDVLNWYKLKHDHYMLHGTTDSRVTHSISEDAWDDVDSCVYHHMTSHVTNGQRQLDRYTSMMVISK